MQMDLPIEGSRTSEKRAKRADLHLASVLEGFELKTKRIVLCCGATDANAAAPIDAYMHAGQIIFDRVAGCAIVKKVV